MNYILIEENQFARMAGDISCIAGFVRQTLEKQQSHDKDKLLDNVEAAELLHISKRTLARMRSEGRIAYSIIEGSCRYSYNDLWDAVERTKVRKFARTQDEFERNYHAVLAKRNVVWKR